ncbi:MAG: hypothetical protein WC412_01430 [Candidatus Omnitrophota bacterium]|jgi:precorrin isomerase
MRFSERKIIFFGLVASSLAFFCASAPRKDKYPFTEVERDPLTPLVTKSGQLLVRRTIGPKGFIVKGIIYSKNGSVAIIGDEVFKENDIIGDYKIVKIGIKKVILKKDKEILILKLEEDNEK